MNRTRWYVALLQAGLLAIFACSSDDSAPGDTTSAGGSDSGADHSATGGAGTSSGAGGTAGSQQGGAGPDATVPDSSTGGAQPDSDVPDASTDANTQADIASDSTTDVSIGDAASDAASDVTDSASDAAVDASPGCSGDLQCQGGAWRCDLNSHTCVPCLPGATDNCPTGQYCTAQFACVAGCKGSSSCSSGTCTNHDCDHCQNDLECSAGKVCGSGVCGPACSAQVTCSTGSDCCGGHCVSFARDILHCGGCPNACSSSQYCGSTGCTVVSIANICGNERTTMLLNSNPPDNASNAVLQSGLTSQCAPPPTADQIAQTSPGPINPSTGQPVVGGGDLLTAAGGFFVQSLVNYLDLAGITPVYLGRQDQDHWRFYRRGGGADAGPDGGASDAVVAEIAWTDSTSARDIILIELVRDPTSGTLALIVFGQHPESTAAAARYVATQMLPVANRSTYDKSWYVYDWSAASDAGPETFTPIASGF